MNSKSNLPYFSGIQTTLYPFKIGFDILDLIDILKKYNIPQKQALAVIRFYT